MRFRFDYHYPSTCQRLFKSVPLLKCYKQIKELLGAILGTLLPLAE